MKQLTRENYSRAIEFLKTNARSLERALFEHEFESGSCQLVIDKLVNFQNEDGGFGNALEPDLRCRESSALATTYALHILDGLELDERGMQVVKQAITYLIQTYREDLIGWDIIPLEAENSPRAAWWDYGAFRDHWGNPNAEIIGYLIKYNSMVSSEFLDRLINNSIEYLNRCDLTEMNEILCYLRLSERLSRQQYSLIEERLNQFVSNCIANQPIDRKEYSIKTLEFIDSPESRYFLKYSDRLPTELDYLIDDQAMDGSWEPYWSWYRFEDDWKIAKEEWKGIITLKNLRVLRNFNRIEK
jgi:hypothetical protein